ncbi:fibroblast growth factor receptor-like 1-like, partial [Silurus meridionalis]
KTKSKLSTMSCVQNPRVTRTDLNLIQLIKAGREGAFYKARMLRGTCKGHSLVTCKIAKEGVTSKQMETEVSIMRKLVYHKNVLQLLDWNTAEGKSLIRPALFLVYPVILLLQAVRVDHGVCELWDPAQLCADTSRQAECRPGDPEPVCYRLLSHRSGHGTLTLQNGIDMHIMTVTLPCNLQVVHCDLALRNILVSRFPWEIKVAEFGLARDLTRMRSRRSTRKKQHRERVPLRWYPPEYFRNSYYSFKGDVWAFGVVLWEMQTFGKISTIMSLHIRSS